MPSSGYKTLQSRLKVNWNVSLQRDDITLERLKSAKLIIFGGPRDKFSASEVRQIRNNMLLPKCIYVVTSEWHINITHIVLESTHPLPGSEPSNMTITP